MKTTYYIILMLLAGVVAAIGTMYDVYLIGRDGGITEADKLIGNAVEITFIWIFVIAAIIPRDSWWIVGIMFVNTLIFWWLCHDVFINIGLHVSVWYIGMGPFDQFMGAIFQQSGALYIGARLFLLLIGSLTYFSLTKKQHV